jgi:ABC-2 type transport system permease protein
VSSIYFLSLRQLQGRWRIAALLAVAALPLVPALIAAASSDEPTALELDDGLINGTLASAVLPILTLVLATPVFGNELDDKTLSNLTLTPLRRWRIVAPKLAAAISVAVPLIVLSAVVSVLVAFEGAQIDGAVRAAAATAIGLAIGALLYTAMFTWLGLRTSRALGVGLLYVFIWEGLFGTFVDGLKYLSVRQYSLSIIRQLDPTRFDGSGQTVIGIGAAAVGAAIVLVAFALLTVRRLHTMEVP